jgi:hypothetical protein
MTGNIVGNNVVKKHVLTGAQQDVLFAFFPNMAPSDLLRLAKDALAFIPNLSLGMCVEAALGARLN